MFTINCNHKIFIIAAGVLAATSLVFAGCYETYSEAPVGTLSVPFEIAYNGSGCEAAGVETVVGVLDDGEYQIETDCARYETIFENIPEGTHSLALYGFNADGIAVVDNLDNGPEIVEVTAYTETTTASPLVLRPTPVLLGARWDFDWGSCESRGIAYFRALVTDEKGRVIFDSLISCNTPGTGDGEFRIMPDPKRNLVDPPVAQIEIQALKNKKKLVSDAHRVFFDAVQVPGPGQMIPLSFKCLEDGCFNSGGGCPASN